ERQRRRPVYFALIHRRQRQRPQLEPLDRLRLRRPRQRLPRPADHAPPRQRPVDAIHPPLALHPVLRQLRPLRDQLIRHPPPPRVLLHFADIIQPPPRQP